MENPYGKFEIAGTVSIPTVGAIPPQTVFAEITQKLEKIPWKWIVFGGATIILMIALASKRRNSKIEQK